MSRRTRLLAALVALAIGGGMLAKTSLFPARRPTPVGASSAEIEREFDHHHRALGALLESCVDRGRVDYPAIEADRSKLEAYLGALAAVTRTEFDTWSDAQQLAMLINLYNAATLKLIIDNYPIDSIKQIGGLFKKPWDLNSLQLFGEETSLGHVEHDLLRKNYAEPRIHFAIVCAAKGCPDLPSEVFTADDLDNQLEEQGEAFLRDQTKNRIDEPKRTVYLSKVFKWFEADFESAGGVIAFVRPYFAPGDRGFLEADFKIRYTHYDWSLNE
jgi:hypothetical protein